MQTRHSVVFVFSHTHTVCATKKPCYDEQTHHAGDTRGSSWLRERVYDTEIRQRRRREGGVGGHGVVLCVPVCITHGHC